MVEAHAQSIKIIKKNQSLLGITEGLAVIKSDALDYIQNYIGKSYDVILIDPPFPLRICEKILQSISQSPVADKSTQIAIEHSKHEPLGEQIGLLSCVDRRSYGDKLVSFYEKGEDVNGPRC